MKIMVINGPNLNMLGLREIGLYGSMTLEEMQNYTHEKLQQHLSAVGLTSNISENEKGNARPQWQVQWFQSNSEGSIIDQIHNLMQGEYHGLVINPGAYAHTSLAIYDALSMLKVPIIEVHLTNIHRREGFRQTLLTAKASTQIMGGFGKESYYLAIYALLLSRELENVPNNRY